MTYADDNRRYAIARLKAPFGAFGVRSGDRLRRTDDMPQTSMLAGLMGNALGLDRTIRKDMEFLQELQDKLRYASVSLTENRLWTDAQVIRPEAKSKAMEPWLGLRDRTVERIAGLKASKRDGALSDATRLQKALKDEIDRFSDFVSKPMTLDKQYRTSLHHLLAFRFEEDDALLEQVAAALATPARALYLGRKACMFSAPVVPGRQRFIAAWGALGAVRHYLASPEADTVDRDAVIVDGGCTGPFPAVWQEGEGADPADDVEAAVFAYIPVHDRRDWLLGAHVGSQFVWRGSTTFLNMPDWAPSVSEWEAGYAG